ncbi:MAG: S8 family serine peptidase [Chloroflexota bacterium]|nr:S8 family serine peptidase [Chloroflexota bacterium]
MHRKVWAPIVALLVVLSLVLGSTPAVAVIGHNPDGAQKTQPSYSTEYAVVALKDKPVASYTGGIQGYGATKPAAGKKLNPNSAAAKKYQTYLAEKRGQYKSFLRTYAPKAAVTEEYALAFNGLAVQLNGVSLATLRKGPGVAAVQYSRFYTKQMNASHNVIGSDALWAKTGGRPNAGRGVKVGVLDSGIDQTHPFFSPAGFDAPAGFPKGDTRFTSDKVIVARVYYHGKPGSYTAQAVDSHGTHVAGTIGGVPYGGAQAKPYPVAGELSGVAPGVWLGNYNVFPGNVASASSEDILEAVEDTVRDGMDVVNMSLGGGSSGIQDLLSMAVDSAVDAGVVFSISAGNSGPGEMTIGSPGVSAKAITVGASTNAHFFGVPVTVGTGQYVGAAGDFPVEPISAALAIAEPILACTAVTNTAEVTGKIVLVQRGACTFTTKVRNAQNAGAVGVIVANSVPGAPSAMGSDGTTPVPTIPAVMVSQSAGAEIAGKEGQEAFIGEVSELPTKADVIASFSSKGPTDVDFRIEPDVTAPGVNVYSSVPCTTPGDAATCGFAVFNGTSMAAPHTAGAAALLRQLHPGWSPEQIRSALVTTGKRPVYSFADETTPVGVQTRGGGRIDLTRADTPDATFSQPTISFGKLEAQRPGTFHRAVRITNTTGAPATYALRMEQTGAYPAAVGVSVSKTHIALAPGASTTFTVTLRNSGTTAARDYEGDVVVTGPSGEADALRLPFWARLK